MNEIRIPGVDGTGRVLLSLDYVGSVEFLTRVDVVVHGPRGTYRAEYGVGVAPHNYEEFYEELRDVHGAAAGEAVLQSAYGDNFKVSVRLDRGKGEISGRIGPLEDPSLSLAFAHISTDTSAVGQTLDDLRRLFKDTQGALLWRVA